MSFHGGVWGHDQWYFLLQGEVQGQLGIEMCIKKVARKCKGHKCVLRDNQEWYFIGAHAKGGSGIVKDRDV